MPMLLFDDSNLKEDEKEKKKKAKKNIGWDSNLKVPTQTRRSRTKEIVEFSTTTCQ